MAEVVTRPVQQGILIYNPVAGGAPSRRQKQIFQAVEVLQDHGTRLEIAVTTGPDSARRLAAEAVSRNVPLIVVCGGDGTINEVINGMAGSTIPLGVLPGGTANILARELRLPASPVQAARALPSWEARRIGLGRVRWAEGERYFLSLAGVGFDAAIIRALSESCKFRWGKAAYAVEALRQWWRHPRVPFECSAASTVRRATFLVLGRTKHYAGSFRVTPGADLFADHLVACLFRGAGRGSYLKYLAGVITGLHATFADVEVYRVQRLGCTPSNDVGNQVYLEVDGELAGSLPAEFELVSDILTLLVPPRPRVSGVVP